MNYGKDILTKLIIVRIEFPICNVKGCEGWEYIGKSYTLDFGTCCEFNPYFDEGEDVKGISFLYPSEIIAVQHLDNLILSIEQSKRKLFDNLCKNNENFNEYKRYKEEEVKK